MDAKSAETLYLEKILGSSGPYFILFGSLFFLGFCLYCGYRVVMIKNASGEKSNLAGILLTGPGMLLALITGTAVAMFVGIGLTSIYKYLDFDHSFAQGSGSLIQAIWGSAATISAAVVAILLALEAIKQAKSTNGLAERSIQLQEKSRELEDRLAHLQRQETPAFKELEVIDSVRREMDWYALSIFPLVDQTGQIGKSTAHMFEYATRRLIAAYSELSKSPVFLVMNDWKLAGLSNQKELDAINLDVGPAFSPSYGGLFNMNFLVGLNVLRNLDSVEKSEEQTVGILNSQGRMFWKYLYATRTALDYFSVEYMERYMDYRINPSLGLFSPQEVVPIENSCRQALDVMAKLGRKMQAG